MSTALAIGSDAHLQPCVVHGIGDLGVIGLERIAFEEMKPASIWIAPDADNVIAAHGHVAVVLPTQALYRKSIGRVFADVFRSEYLAEISGTDGLARRQLPADKTGGGRLAKALQYPS
jgi:hypothetical protein